MSAGRIVVAGGGPAGLAFACACRDLRVCVIEASARPAEQTSELDVRIFALSAGTHAFLRSIEAWDRLDMERMTPVRRMEVFGDAGARLTFAARQGAALAWIVEAGRLSAALEQQAASLGSVTLRRGVQLDRFEATADRVRIGLQGGEELEVDLLVGADGPDSKVRTSLGLPVAQRAYGETAIVANFEVEKDHGHVARQWFRRDGVLAWLPLPGRRMSIVWSARDALAEEIARLAPDQLATRVRDAGAAALGDLRLASRLAAFPLRFTRVDRTVAPGVALVGDAAHGLHPLAGQGVNLGFQDSRVLADVLAGRSPLERPGDLRLLRRYARARREDVTAMQFVTDGLDRLFGSDTPGASWLRNAGMGLVEAQPWIKGALAERAMR